MAKLRAALRDKFGPRRYRITCKAEVEVYGTMPNIGKADGISSGTSKTCTIGLI